VHVPEGGHGQLYQGAATQAISGPAKLSLADGEKVVFTDEEGFDYHVRVYHPPLMPRSAKHPFRAKLWGISLGLAISAHLLFALSLVFSASVLHVTLPVADPQLAETFAEVKEVKDPDKPKPKKKRRRRPKPKRPKPKKVDPTEAKPKISKRLERRIQRRIKRRGGGGGGATALINQLRSPVAGEGETLKEVVSNIEAFKGRPTSGAHRVAGTLAALPDGKINLARGGSVDVGTLSGKEIAGKAGKLRGRKGTGKVRGRVSGFSAMTKVSGQLSRAEVIETINKHLGAIQGCYERALLKNPSLSGKITFEWTVRPSGRVSNPREKSSTLSSPQVSQCIIRVIRKMRFPKPRGGEVIIAYPFMFRSA
ncbi:MAG: hypothetical protein D6729_03505, partial [Deltaproteobacteria bacterium]